MTIVFDLDGVVIYDDNKYSASQFRLTPMAELVSHFRKTFRVIAVTGRSEEQLPEQVRTLFDEVHCRPSGPFLYKEYMEWKCNVITEIKPDLVFEDRLEIVEQLRSHGIIAVWVPTYYGGE